VVALGYPLSGLLATTANLTVGNVSALAGIGDDSRYLQISAPVQPGNSGGPLLDPSGHLVGIVTSKLNAASVARYTGDIPQNVNFAIKAEVARTFLDSKGIVYRTVRSDQQLSPADVGDMARPFTVYIECEQAPSRSAAAPVMPAPEARASRPPAADDGQVCRQQTGDDAIAACTHIIASGNKESSTLAWALGNRGTHYLSKGDYDRAIRDFDQALTLDPKIPIYVNRGFAYDNRGDHDRATNDYDQAIKLNPNDVIAFNRRGIAYYNKGDYDRAIADYNEATALDPKYALAFNNRGLVYAAKKDYRLAIADYSEALRLDPKLAGTFYSRGNAYRANGDLDRAIADYDEAIKLNPKYAPAFNNRGSAYRLKGDYDRAIMDLDQSIELDPKNVIAFNSRADSYRRKGDYDRAIEDYSHALRLDPKNVAAYGNRGFTYFVNTDFLAAAADLQRSIELGSSEPPIPRAYLMLWRYLARARAGNFGGGEELAANAARLKPKEWPYPVIEFYLGKRSAGEMSSAAAKPEERCEAQFYIGEWYLMRGDRMKAAGALRTAAETCPKTFYEYDGAMAELKRLNQ
jgi:tetratricopeptide (TPR) repeat protein